MDDDYDDYSDGEQVDDDINPFDTYLHPIKRLWSGVYSRQFFISNLKERISDWSPLDKNLASYSTIKVNLLVSISNASSKQESHLVKRGVTPGWGWSGWH